MDVFWLDRVPWEDSQSLYHAAAYLGRAALFILRPDTPYVCLGCHQDAAQEIDLDYARSAGLPVFRREVGGGAVYLDSGQLFYQIVLPKGHPALPPGREALFRELLAPVVAVFQKFGVPAVYRPVNDILANGRKISGNGAAEIEESVVLVGNFILDFNYEQMVRVLRVPDEKFRDKVYKTLQENLTTMQCESGRMPSTNALAEALIAQCEPRLGPLDMKTAVDPVLQAEAQRRFAAMNTDDWLFENDLRQERTKLKIREGVYVVQRVAKLPGGLVRLTAAVEDGRLAGLHLSGDFFVYPAPALALLEQRLEGTLYDHATIENTIAQAYQELDLETPGILPIELAALLFVG
jgi:lipoate---protein ligase